MTINASTGSIKTLNRFDNLDLFAIEYVTYDAKDYFAFFNEYSPHPVPWWVYHDFGKPGSEPNSVENVSVHTDIHMKLTEIFTRTHSNSHEEGADEWVDVLLHMVPTTEYAGTASNYWTEISMSSSSSLLNVAVYVYNKTSTRLPEALWVSLTPPLSGRYVIGEVHKVGEWIDVKDVVNNGSKTLHGVDEGVRIRDPSGSAPPFMVSVVDAPTVAFGDEPVAFPLPLHSTPPANKRSAFWSLLTANTWGTNFIMWYPYAVDGVPVKGMENLMFRYSVTF